MQPGLLLMVCGRKRSAELVRAGKGHANPPMAGDNQDREAAPAARRIAASRAAPMGEHRGKGMSVLPARTEARRKPAGRTLVAALGGEKTPSPVDQHEKEQKR